MKLVAVVTAAVLAVAMNFCPAQILAQPRVYTWPNGDRYEGEFQDSERTGRGTLVPTAAELPSIDGRHLERPSPSTLGGFKGVGEGGTIGAPAAIANAVADALTPLGVDVSELPITPERLFRLLGAVPRHHAGA